MLRRDDRHVALVVDHVESTRFADLVGDPFKVWLRCHLFRADLVETLLSAGVRKDCRHLGVREKSKDGSELLCVSVAAVCRS